MSTKEAVILCDVAPRDGFQVVPTWIPTETKISIIEGLAAAGLSRIEAGEHALVARGHLGHAATISVATLGEGVEALFVETVPAELHDHVGDRITGKLMPQGVTAEELTLRHMQRRTVARRQPGRQAKVVRVAVGDDQA